MLGTVVPLEKGPEADEFFLTFDAVGGLAYARPPLPTPPAPAPVDLPPSADVGARTFDEIDATMAAITGVDPNDQNVRTTFETVRQSLPAVATLEAVLASHQVAIAQLAIEYCHALIEDPTLRANMFPAFQFGQPPATAFASEGDLVGPLLDRVLGVTHLQTQPDRLTVENELHELLYGIPSDSTRPGLIYTPGAPNDAARTRTLAKAVCSAVLGSAAMLVQ
jgi:hypothetical protein